MSDGERRCKNLVLDSGPLLSLSPLRGLADTYLTVPQVLDELKDKRAREHFEQLGLSTGVRVNVRNPDPASLSQVIQFAKKTGDYAVLSHADLCVLALTHTLHVQEEAILENRKEEARRSTEAPSEGAGQEARADSSEPRATEAEDVEDLNRATEDLSNLSLDNQSYSGNNIQDHQRVPPDTEPSGSESDSPPSHPDVTQRSAAELPLYDDPSTDDDDGEGEWITPDTVALHKSRALDLLPSSGGNLRKGRRNADEVPVLAGCMTADFAMQNVLLQMGLSLVGTEGKRIQKVKSWVLRCHACFKICKDNSKQFCPSCGNPTLLRASVTVASPDAAVDAPAMEIHLKKNFQYKLRGTKYSIPAPKPGSAKTGPGEGLILREDQTEYMRAKKRVEGKRERDEQRMIKGLVDRGGEGGVAVGSWSDPDWMPSIMGGSTKGRSTGKDAMPQIGYGRKNPNERRKHK
ncbi:Nin one binding Zn-ribbon like-domain-containing protein [Melanogaster broomeanus]|nr:Nin one binding Zn-ribbon like-domain-containing protein [Melanogaster broomeanus]